MRRLAVGLIGAGKHGQRYVHHIRADVPEIALVALSRRDPVRGAAQARELGCRFHEDWRELVADAAVEAVVAVVPPSLHPAIATTVAAARKPLLVEKPLAVTGEAARRLVRDLRAAGTPCLMAHTLRWNTVVNAMRERLPDLGPLRTLVLNQRFEPSPLAWLDDPAISGGGLLLHTGVHAFDLVRWLTGREVIRTWCRVARAVTRRTEDNFVAVLALEGCETLVVVNGSRASAGRSGMIDVAGAEGQLVGDHFHGFVQAIRGSERTPLELPPVVPTVREALRAFVRLVQAGERPPVEIEDGARAVLVAEACRRSAEGGSREAPVPTLD
jgi:predicted dehydrogenase